MLTFTRLKPTTSLNQTKPNENLSQKKVIAPLASIIKIILHPHHVLT